MGLINLFKTKQSESVRSLIILISMALFGAAMALPGSALLDLQISIQLSFTITSRLIVYRSIGYFMGAFSAGALENYYNRYMGMFLSANIGGFLLIIFPLIPYFYLMAICIFLLGFWLAFMDLVSYTIIFSIWKENSGPFVQALMTAYSLGALLGPVLIRPFLLPLNPEIVDSDTIYQYSYQPSDVTVHWAFLPVGLSLIAASIPYLTFYLKDRTLAIIKEDLPESDKSESSPPLIRQYIPVIAVAILYHLGYGAVTPLTNFTPAYGVKSDLHMSKESSNTLITLMWAGSIASRLCSIFLSIYFEPKKIYPFAVNGCILSAILFACYANSHEICLYISLIGYSIFRSPMAGIALTFLNGHFTISSRQTSVIFLVGISGEAIHPAIVSQFIDSEPNFFIYYVSFLIVLQQFVFLSIPWMCKKLFHQTPQIDLEDEIVPQTVSRLNSIVGIDSRFLRPRISITSVGH